MQQRKTSCLLTLCLLFIPAGSSSAQRKPDAPVAARLAPMEWLVGAPWDSEVKDPQSGKVIHVENTIQWAPNRSAISFLTKFEGEAHYNGFYAYNAATKLIEFYYTSSSGELTIGHTDPDPDGKTLVQEFDIMKVDGSRQHVRSTIVRDGSDAYWLAVFLQKNGEWTQEFRIRYARQAAGQ